MKPRWVDIIALYSCAYIIKFLTWLASFFVSCGDKIQEKYKEKS